MSHLTLTTTYEIAVLIRIIFQMSVGGVKQLAQVLSQQVVELMFKLCQYRLQMLCFLLLMILYPDVESWLLLWAPVACGIAESCLVIRLCGEASLVQGWAVSPCKREEGRRQKNEERLSPDSRGVQCIWQAPHTDTRPSMQHRWGMEALKMRPISLHHVCFYYWEECDRVSSSPYFIPASVWSAGMKTTGSSSYSK